MRGEPNAIGIPTKWAPSRNKHAYFSDADWNNHQVMDAINVAFAKIEEALTGGLNVIIPANGIGTGLAQLPARAPRIYILIRQKIAQLEIEEKQL